MSIQRVGICGWMYNPLCSTCTCKYIHTLVQYSFFVDVLQSVQWYSYIYLSFPHIYMYKHICIGFSLKRVRVAQRHAEKWATPSFQ